MPGAPADASGWTASWRAPTPPITRRAIRSADFTTRPEISQVFGEILGLWAAVAWDSRAGPDPVLLVEAGPGPRHADGRRSAGRRPDVAPAFPAALRLHLIETSPRLRASRRSACRTRSGTSGLDTLPDPAAAAAGQRVPRRAADPAVRAARGGVGGAVRRGRAFRGMCPRPLDPPAGEGGGGPPRPAGDAARPALTISPAIAAARRLAACTAAPRCSSTTAPSAARPATASRRCAMAGRPIPLADPGTADLTAHVDFAAFAAAARAAGAAAHGPVPQGLFLARLGLFQRTDRLARTQPPAQAAALIDAARRLAEPDRMGRLFKALAVCHPGLPTPPGFEPDARTAPAHRQKPPCRSPPLAPRAAWLLHPPRRRLRRALRQPQLQPVGRRRARAVLENRARAAARDRRRTRIACVGLTQVHGADVVDVTAAVAPGRRPARRRDGDRPARYRARHHHRRLRARPARRPGRPA